MGAVQYFGNGECPRLSRRRVRTRGSVGTPSPGGFPANPTVRGFSYPRWGTLPPSSDRSRPTDRDSRSPLPSQPLRFTSAPRLLSAWASASSRAPCGRCADPPDPTPPRTTRMNDENITTGRPRSPDSQPPPPVAELALADPRQGAGVLRQHQGEVSVGTDPRARAPTAADHPSLYHVAD